MNYKRYNIRKTIMIIITNNKYVFEKFKYDFNIIYSEDLTYIEILQVARDKVYEGHRLMTHPMSSSIKPNETLYKSIIISEEKLNLDFRDIRDIEIIGESILVAESFLKDKITPNWTREVLQDFKTIDLSLTENVIKKLSY